VSEYIEWSSVESATKASITRAIVDGYVDAVLDGAMITLAIVAARLVDECVATREDTRDSATAMKTLRDVLQRMRLTPFDRGGSHSDDLDQILAEFRDSASDGATSPLGD